MTDNPAPIMVALDGFSTVHPFDFTARKGTRLRADHPIVQAHPELFAPDGDDAELAHRSTAFAAATGAFEGYAAPTEPPKPRVPVARRMIATESIYVGSRLIPKGSEHDRDDDVVTRAPGFFHPAIPTE